MKRAIPFLRRTLRITGSHRSALEVAQGRLVLISALFAVMYILIAARMVDLSVIQGQWNKQDTDTVAEQQDGDGDAGSSSQARADITDRNGVLLATSLATASLFADTTLIADPDSVARRLADTLPGLNYNDALGDLKRKTHFIWIKRNLTPDEQFAVLKLGEPGLQFRTEYRRIYPQGPLTSHIVGFTNIDGHGLMGIERSFDPQLLKGGAPLALSLDVRLQHILRRETRKTIADFSANGGAGAILDLKTGEVLAAVSEPDFDPNDPGAAEGPAHFNMLTQGGYELGSTFKIFSVSAFLEDKHPALSTTFNCSHPLHVGKFTIHDFDPEGRWLTIPEVFMYSSNIGASQMGEDVGGAALEKYYRDLGFGQPLPLEIKEVSRPHLPAAPWSEISTMTASFGHGVSVSPLQLVAAAASVANDGIVVHPTLLLDHAQQDSKPQMRILSAETSRKMREMMRLVVTKGTARQADVPGYEIGGKTGTADKPSGGGYDHHKKLSSFLGFFPINAPRYAVYVLIDEPHPNKKTYGFATGGWVGAPAVGRIVAAMGPLLGMSPHDVPPTDDLAQPLLQYVKVARAAR